MIDKQFWYQEPEILWKNLIWKKIKKYNIEWIINEVEIYWWKFDPASHAYRWKTSRNWPMFWKWWLIYVYLIYGIHYCFNISFGWNTWAVLIRWVKPVYWIETIIRNRKTNKIKNLVNWPGKFTQAFGIDLSYNWLSLYDDSNDIIIKEWVNDFDFYTTSRVWISKWKDKKYRFVINKL